MKRTLFPTLICLFSAHYLFAQADKIENIVIITTDGFRWQEVFTGMDSSIAINPSFNQNDSLDIFKQYWAKTAAERRKKLLPFLWNVIAKNGQIYGNRLLDNKVNNANPYWFSYPGYNEIFTGYVDTAINTNDYPPNPNTTLLEFLNQKEEFKGRIAAFGAWDAFHRIFNESRCGFPVFCSESRYGGAAPDSEEQLLNQMKDDTYNPLGAEEKLDVFTHYAAMDYLQKKQPRILYISYGETDEWAHHAHYKDYLDAAHTVDKWIGDIWAYIQSTEQYRNKTLLFITVDHGRGTGDKWTSHNNKVPNSNEIWFGIMGPKIPAKGEISASMQLYQDQYAQTLAQLLGDNFSSGHPVAKGFKSLLLK